MSGNPFGDPAPPRSLLDFHRVLSTSAGVRVSPLCLGAMNFGDAWKGMMGECNKEQTFEMLDYFYDNGGNFIDTANNYQGEESETWIGEWMAARKNRDQIVIATKFTTCFVSARNPKPALMVNYVGNNTKSLHLSLEASLKKLQTTYLDVLYLHWWDFTTGIEELMQSLNALVLAGKVLYLGVSDTPAWIVSKANQYARDHGFRPFSVYQGRWSAADRDFERDILPMARAEGMALAPWGALGGGHFKTDAQREAAEGRKFGKASDKHVAISKKLEAVAEKKGTLITSVALAYVMHKYPYVFPIVGGRKVEHLKGNIEALGLQLTEEEIDDIDSAVPFEVGFPMNMLFEMTGKKYNTRMTSADVGLSNFAGHYDAVPHQAHIQPRKL
ncbi:aryl-alcohol dehydrogenase-like protein [Lophium mytilinum]|uniref:Aryl-alcohol dehydrogenase-like protein n=1 Tax=Lophium mytilinum TaxID=390894 RepID=A0A6A6QQ08_9PEZI|nr:aryl-alcohol dehydrogenase-like protein [Lophium mytilinum]